MLKEDTSVAAALLPPSNPLLFTEESDTQLVAGAAVPLVRARGVIGADAVELPIRVTEAEPVDAWFARMIELTVGELNVKLVRAVANCAPAVIAQIAMVPRAGSPLTFNALDDIQLELAEVVLFIRDCIDDWLCPKCCPRTVTETAHVCGTLVTTEEHTIGAS